MRTGSPYMATMLRAWLGIPDPLRVYELIPIGWPLRQPQATPRRALDSVTASPSSTKPRT